MICKHCNQHAIGQSRDNGNPLCPEHSRGVVIVVLPQENDDE